MASETEAPTGEQLEAASEAFTKARDTIPDGEVLCATVASNGRPIYFHAPVDATHEVVRSLAFKARNGREMSTAELLLAEKANLPLIEDRRT